MDEKKIKFNLKLSLFWNCIKKKLVDETAWKFNKKFYIIIGKNSIKYCLF